MDAFALKNYIYISIPIACVLTFEQSGNTHRSRSQNVRHNSRRCWRWQQTSCKAVQSAKNESKKMKKRTQNWKSINITVNQLFWKLFWPLQRTSSTNIFCAWKSQKKSIKMFKSHLEMIGRNESPSKKAKFWQSYIRSLKGKQIY